MKLDGDAGVIVKYLPRSEIIRIGGRAQGGLKHKLQPGDLPLANFIRLLAVDDLPEESRVALAAGDPSKVPTVAAVAEELGEEVLLVDDETRLWSEKSVAPFLAAVQ